MAKLRGGGLRIMQTHGNEELQIYTEAFVEAGFRPLKRYKRFTHGLLILAWNFFLAYIENPAMEKSFLTFLSIDVGMITLVLLIVLCNNRTSSYLNRFFHDGLGFLDISISLLIFAYQEMEAAIGSKPGVAAILCLAWAAFVALVIGIKHKSVIKGHDFKYRRKGEYSNIGVYAGIGGIFGIFLARWIATQDVSNLYPTGLFTLCSFLMSIGTLSFLKAYYVKKYHLTADTDTK